MARCLPPFIHTLLIFLKEQFKEETTREKNTVAYGYMSAIVELTFKILLKKMVVQLLSSKIFKNNFFTSFLLHSDVPYNFTLSKTVSS